eukprot:16251119-Heterocapsa_arctica.AAC.1
MEKERSSLREFCVYDRVPAEEVPAVWEDADATVVRSRWVKVLKADGRTKCRLVAQQINDGSKMDVYAATASSISARTLLVLAAARRRRNQN